MWNQRYSPQRDDNDHAVIDAHVAGKGPIKTPPIAWHVIEVELPPALGFIVNITYVKVAPIWRSGNDLDDETGSDRANRRAPGPAVPTLGPMARRQSKASEPSGDQVSLLLDDQLCFALYSAAQSIQSLYRPLLKALDLTYPQYLVLLVLWEGDGLSVSEIGERLFLNSATLTPLLKRMEAASLIERRRSASDERRLVISLTAKGARLKSKVQPVTAEVTGAACAASDHPDALLNNLVELRERLPAAT